MLVHEYRLPCSITVRVIESDEVRPKSAGLRRPPRDMWAFGIGLSFSSICTPFQEDGIAVIQPSDTPTSQFAATRWTLRRRLGLLLRTRFDAEGATLSLHDVATRTHGRVPVAQLTAMLSDDTASSHDPVTYVLLAQAFDVDPDFFVTDEAVASYIAAIRHEASDRGVAETGVSLQRLARLSAMGDSALAATSVA